MDSLKELVSLCISAKSTYRLSEIDTQVLLVEPILRLIGWDTMDVNQMRRAGRQTRGSNSQVFDVELYGDMLMPRIVIECKRLRDITFNVKMIGEEGKLLCTAKGHKQVKSNDGLAQLRRYCVDYERKFDPSITIPVFTDGETWVAFRGTAFVSNPEDVVPRSACLFDPLSVHAPNFLEVVGAYLSRKRFGEG